MKGMNFNINEKVILLNRVSFNFSLGSYRMLIIVQCRVGSGNRAKVCNCIYRRANLSRSWWRQDYWFLGQ